MMVSVDSSLAFSDYNGSLTSLSLRMILNRHKLVI